MRIELYRKISIIIGVIRQRKETKKMTIDRTSGTVTFTTEEMNSIKAINAASRAEALEQVREILNLNGIYSAKLNLVKNTKELVVDETMTANITYSKGKVKSVDFIDIDNPFFVIAKIK